jgi:Na+-translocating ferredoxin:NAD+ oxidoreductase RNF subunit RnfB
MEVLYTVLLLFGISFIFAILLAYFGTKLKVNEDTRVKEVADKLAGANCGACGFAGCADFAKALVEGKAKITDCNSTSKSNKDEIALLLGMKNDGEDTIVVVACKGGNRCNDKYAYKGYGDCRSMEMLAGGRKECETGCMGMGSCVDACQNMAIEVGQDGFAVINQKKCTKCGLCIKTCPKLLCKRIPSSAKVYIACSNRNKGLAVKNVCSSGCIACTLCVKKCPNSAITMENNLPVIDYSKCSGCLKCVESCPNKVITKVEN